jgi:transcriptional regulator with XRE-family HTH domain
MPPVESLDPDSSIWHWIAADLRFWREREGLSLSQMGAILNCTKATVSNLEHARPGFRLNGSQVSAADQHFQLNGHFRRLLQYAKAGHDADWFREHVTYEHRATAIRHFASLVVPGLLQTEQYARGWLALASHDVDGAVRARLERQEILRKPTAPDIWIMLDEAVLRRPMGGASTMAEQLGRLLEVSEMRTVSVRVVPFTAGGHLGLEGSFSLTTVTEGMVAYFEACGGGRLSTDRQEVAGFDVRFHRIGDLALPVDASRELIKSVREGLQ